MKLSDGLQKGLNEQIRLEYNSAYIYKGMAMYFADLGLEGFRKFFDDHVKEEIKHANDFINYIVEVDGKVELGALTEVETDFNSILDVFEKAYEHELLISKSIQDLNAQAIEEKNYAAENFLRTYIDEQVEEEDLFLGLKEMVEFAGDDKSAIFQMNGMLRNLHDHLD